MTKGLPRARLGVLVDKPLKLLVNKTLLKLLVDKSLKLLVDKLSRLISTNDAEAAYSPEIPRNESCAKPATLVCRNATKRFMPPPKSIAVLGGGLSGLSSAFHLSRRFPAAKVTLIEKQTRLGGWVRSQRVNIQENLSILLEAGPRTLRPNSKSVLELVMCSEIYFAG